MEAVNRFVSNSDELSKAALSDDSVLQELRKAIVNFSESLNGADRDGSSLYDVQRGVFMLLQGSAYRMHMKRWACDYHTHERDYSLPYLFSNFVHFTRNMVEMIKEIQVVDAQYFPILEDLANCVEQEEKAIRDRIANWNVEQEKAWRESEKALDEDKNRIKASEQPAAPQPKKASETPSWLKIDDKPTNTFDAAFQEGFGEYNHEGDSSLFLKRQNQIFLDSGDDVPGCILSESFWYKKYTPKLLAACSVSVPGYGEDESEDSLNAWFEAKKTQGVFNKFGADVRDGWATLPRKHKLSVKRAWRLCEPYFFGPQKQRERSADSGVDHRETGDLSQYVAFIDVYLGKSYVELEGMRLTFPYLIGPATWILHHTVAERAASWHESNTDASKALVARFKQYMSYFVTVYPCPYCRNHLNRYVIIGKERDLYPVEYLFVGWTPTPENLRGEITVQDKLSYITDGLRLRLFVWKLHNAVNSSIARQEEWYNREESAINTSRYWPNVDAELYRASLRSGVVSAARLIELMDIIKVATKLNALRKSILEVEAGNIPELMQVVNPLLDSLDEELVNSGFLQETFAFVPNSPDPVVDINWAEKFGHLVRHEDFTLN